MDRQTVLDKIAGDVQALHEMGVKSLSLFGSHARNNAREDSDIDLLVEFERPIGLFHFFEIQEHLEALLGQRVDLVMRTALLPELRPRIEEEAIRAA